MHYLLLVLVVVFTSSQHLMQKQYTVHVPKQNAFLFSAATALTALVFFWISAGCSLNFSSALWPYSLAYAVSYAMATVGLVFAIRFGSLAISSLIISYSLIIPAGYGILFLKEPAGINTYIGLALLFVSLWLLNISKEEYKVSMKWVVCIGVAFIGNGMCSTVQKMQQMQFAGAYKSEFMILALAVVFAVLFLLSLKQTRNVREMLPCIKFALPNGIFNGAVNLLVMVLTGMVPNAVLFPSISAGGIVLSCLLAVFVYKEKLTRAQIVGYIMGTSSVVLLNLS